MADTQDIDSVWDAARSGLTRADFQALLDVGVPRNITALMPGDAGLRVGADDIAVKGKGWERRFMGERAIVFPVWGLDWDRSDIWSDAAAQALDIENHILESVTKFRERMDAEGNEKIVAQCDHILALQPRMIERAEARYQKHARRAAHVPVNLVAFRLDTPRSFWLFDPTGHAPYLGHDAVERAIFYHEPLMVHESPLDWLKAGCQGCVILQWNHYWPAYFGGVSALRAMSPSFGEKLQARLAAPLPVPEIQVAA